MIGIKGKGLVRLRRAAPPPPRRRLLLLGLLLLVLVVVVLLGLVLVLHNLLLPRQGSAFLLSLQRETGVSHCGGVELVLLLHLALTRGFTTGFTIGLTLTSPQTYT